MKADFRFGPPKAWSNENVLKKIMLNVRECGDCWDWHGSFNGAGSAQIRAGGTALGVRRTLFALLRGKVDGFCIVGTCDNPKCVNPAHSKKLTVQQKMKLAASKAATPMRNAKIARVQRERVGKITDDQRREMRHSNESSRWWAAKLGVSQKTAWKAMTRDVTDNLFMGLMR